MPLLLMLLTFAATAAVAQTPPASPLDSPARSAAAEAAADARHLAPSAAPAEVTPPIDRGGAAHEGGAASAAQPTVQGFLYHVFLTAVTALVTALIWRAVF